MKEPKTKIVILKYDRKQRYKVLQRFQPIMAWNGRMFVQTGIQTIYEVRSNFDNALLLESPVEAHVDSFLLTSTLF